MIIYLENETDVTFPFDEEELVNRVALKVLEVEKCPFDVEINVLITDSEGIKEYNSMYRGIDKETDVLSFPGLDFELPGKFYIPKEERANYENPESGKIVLGDIVLCASRVYEQAKEYGHSVLREYAFLIAHSLYHLCGYDHMEADEAQEMEQKQENILQLLQITREM